MIRGRQWWVIIPVMFGSGFLILAGLKMLQHEFPQLFPRIQGPRFPTLWLVGGLWIVVFVLISRWIEPVMQRQPLFRGFVMGVFIGGLNFVLDLVA